MRFTLPLGFRRVAATLSKGMMKEKHHVADSFRKAAILCFVLAALAGCAPPPTSESVAEQPVAERDWRALLADLRAFERRIGFSATANFLAYSEARASYPFCGRVSRFYLPYSYLDPAIQWLDAVGEAECRAVDPHTDVIFGESEAVGESAAPLTPAMLAAPLDRFVYLVIHEDCHDQFKYPFGIEEALCNVIAFNAMEAFAQERFGEGTAETAALRRFVQEGRERAQAIVSVYDSLAALFARHSAARMSSAAFLRERAERLRAAEEALGWVEGALNNVSLANFMTYSRHSAPLERIHTALGGDLAETVAFFRRVDAAKPAAADVVTAHRLTDARSADVLRLHENAILAAARRAMPQGARSASQPADE